MKVTISSETSGKDEYIEFLKHTDPGTQYQKENFAQRIEKLLSNASISLCARDESGRLAGVLLGLTDFAYWLFVTDPGVRRDCERKGIGSALIRKAIETAGGENRLPSILPAMRMPFLFMKNSG